MYEDVGPIGSTQEVLTAKRDHVGVGHPAFELSGGGNLGARVAEASSDDASVSGEIRQVAGRNGELDRRPLGNPPSEDAIGILGGTQFVDVSAKAVPFWSRHLRKGEPRERRDESGAHPFAERAAGRRMMNRHLVDQPLPSHLPRREPAFANERAHASGGDPLTFSEVRDALLDHIHNYTDRGIAVYMV